MQRPFFKHIITFLFLATFLVPRVVDLHAFDHVSEDDEAPVSCELCDIVVHSQELDLLLDVVLYHEVQLISTPSSLVVSSTYDMPLEHIASPISVYNKPPPLL